MIRTALGAALLAVAASVVATSISHTQDTSFPFRDVTVFPKVIPVNTDSAITITADLHSAASVLGVQVARLNDSGKATNFLGQLYDDGTGQDALAGDGVYTGRVTVAGLAPGQIQLQLVVKVRPKTVLFSDVYRIDVVDAAGVGDVSSDGGVVTVANDNSPLSGLTLRFNEGTFTSTARVFIREQADTGTPLPDDTGPLGPAFDLSSTQVPAKPVVLEMPFARGHSDPEDELRLLFHFNEEDGQWVAVPALPSPDPDTIRVRLEHFSVYQRGVVRDTTQERSTGFRSDVDGVGANNDGNESTSCLEGWCTGASYLSTIYFNDRAARDNVGLACRWERSKAADLACDVHELIANGSLDNFVRTIYPAAVMGVQQIQSAALTTEFVTDYIRHRLGFGPVPITMLTVPYDPDRNHSVVVTGWRRTGADSSVFTVYDNQSFSRTSQLATVRRSLRVVPYPPFFLYAQEFHYTSVGGVLYQLPGVTPTGPWRRDILALIDRNPPAADVCDGAPTSLLFPGGSYSSMNIGFSGPKTLGIQFVPQSDVQVTHLGFFDALADGLIENHIFRIYDNSTGQSLTTASVSAGQGTLFSQLGVEAVPSFRAESYRGTALNPPVNLIAGRTYTVVATMDREQWYYNGSLAADPMIVYLRDVAEVGASVFPVLATNSQWFAYPSQYGVGFAYRPLPAR